MGLFDWYNKGKPYSFIPEGTGQVFEVRLEDLAAFNEAMNAALIKAMREAANNPPAEPPGDNEFDCALCHERFTKDGRSEEEKLAEARSYFGEIPEEERVSVCDDCWNKIHPARN